MGDCRSKNKQTVQYVTTEGRSDTHVTVSCITVVLLRAVIGRFIFAKQ